MFIINILNLEQNLFSCLLARSSYILAPDIYVPQETAVLGAVQDIHGFEHDLKT